MPQGCGAPQDTAVCVACYRECVWNPLISAYSAIPVTEAISPINGRLHLRIREVVSTLSYEFMIPVLTATGVHRQENPRLESLKGIMDTDLDRFLIAETAA